MKVMVGVITGILLLLGSKKIILDRQEQRKRLKGNTHLVSDLLVKLRFEMMSPRRNSERMSKITLHRNLLMRDL